MPFVGLAARDCDFARNWWREKRDLSVGRCGSGGAGDRVGDGAQDEARLEATIAFASESPVMCGETFFVRKGSLVGVPRFGVWLRRAAAMSRACRSIDGWDELACKIIEPIDPGSGPLPNLDASFSSGA